MKKEQYKTKNLNKQKQSSFKTVEEAVNYFKENIKGKFDHTFECQIALRLPEKNKSETVRFSIVPNHPFGKDVKVLVLAEGADQQTATTSGADFVGLDEYVEKIMNGWSDFDVVIATPQVMPKIAKLGKVLGPKGMMPNPKTETVTTDLQKVIANYKKGKMDFKMAESGQIAFKFGKMSMDNSELLDNYNQMMEGLKGEVSRFGGNVMAKIYVKTTMSPAVVIK